MRSQLPNIGLYLVGFGVALGASLGLTFAVRECAARLGLFDPSDDRKLHARKIPRIGGVAIFLSCAAALLALAMTGGRAAVSQVGAGLPVVLAGAAGMLAVGLWDDLRPMRARWKFVAQLVVSVAVALAGVRFSLLALPFVGQVQLDAALGFLLTVLWLVGITNAFNLIDGLDGLAAGAALFALTTMFVVGTVNGQTSAALVTLVLAGATLGFLFYNFYPASIFLGDSGSLFLGFMLAGIGLLSSQKSPTVVAIAIPVVSLGLPVLDTVLAICRRFLRHQPISTADRGHIHHRLLNLGHSPRKVALLLYGACAALAFAAMLLVNDSEYVALLLVLVGLGVGLAVQRLRFYEFEELARVFRRGLRQRDVIARGVRIREASVQLATLSDLGTVFRTLERTFAVDEFVRAEVRLRPSFIASGRCTGADRRSEDEVAVWAWSRNGEAHPAWWEIRLPLLDASGDRIGSLVLWQDGLASETSLSHLHTITGELRAQVQRKLLALWRGDSAFAAAGRAAFERVVPIPSGDDGAAAAAPPAPEAGVERARERRADSRGASTNVA